MKVRSSFVKLMLVAAAAAAVPLLTGHDAEAQQLPPAPYLYFGRAIAGGSAVPDGLRASGGRTAMLIDRRKRLMDIDLWRWLDNVGQSPTLINDLFALVRAG